MKIIEYEYKGNIVKVYTDVGEFAYPACKFGGVDALSSEIVKKIAWDAKVKAKKNKKEDLTLDFKDKNIKEKKVEVLPVA